jgi:hypothetical protein
MMFRQSDLEAYLDEALPPEEMARIEKSMREDRALVQQLAGVHARRNTGVHSLGEIWRQHRLSCPSREQLRSYLLGTLAEACANNIAFHVQVVGCRYCQANLVDLESRQAGAEPLAHARRRKFFQSSAGYLRAKKGDSGGNKPRGN